jgi:superfamily II DNA or RNA helicase
MTESYEYDIEMNEIAPRWQQPAKINIPLKPHQLACLGKAISMEETGIIHYNLKESSSNYNTVYHNKNIKNNVRCSTNIGVLADQVGYGKTLTALSIVAESKNIHINPNMHVSYSNSKHYSYISYSTTNENIIDDIIQSTLIIVPRGPVYVQWQRALENHTKLKYLAIDNLNFIKKHLPEYKDNNVQAIVDFFNGYDVVLVKNTTLGILLNYYQQAHVYDRNVELSFMKRWKRIMIDEAHDICNKIPDMYYEFLWLISGTYENLLYSSRSYNSIIFHMRDAINYDTLNLIIVKCTKEFVKNSFKIPVPNEKYYLCKMPANVGIIRGFISATVLEKINANDINGAIRDLGGKSETENNVIELVSKEIKRDIMNKEKEKSYIESLDIPEEQKTMRMKNIEVDIHNNKLKLENLRQRVSELNKKTCAICMCLMEHPIILECTHSYCASCIMQWISSQRSNINCPECRQHIDADKMIAIVNKKSTNQPKEQSYSKEDTLLKIIQDNPNGKYLIFSKYDSGFMKIMNIMMDNNITCSELKGNTAHMMNVLDKFKSGNIKVILLNTHFAGSGIDISYATDVIIYHTMGLAKYQAIGRAQRVGRTDVLNIHHLCYEHEMNNEHQDTEEPIRQNADELQNEVIFS